MTYEIKEKDSFEMKAKLATIALVSTLTISGCQSTGQGPTGEGMGGFLGGVAGGVIGNQFGEGSGNTAATIGGALLGMWIGSNLGAHLTEGDRGYYNQATQTAYNAPNGETIAWDNPETGHMGTVTPTRSGRTQSGAYCREFQQTITIDGATERAYGTACQQPDGSWQIVN
jgi:surface antigen